jgi:hypothetical protein
VKEINEKKKRERINIPFILFQLDLTETTLNTILEISANINSDLSYLEYKLVWVAS